MAASFPGAIKSFSAIVNGVTKLVAALFNSPYDEITAIETELGTDPAGSATDLKTRLAISLNDSGTVKGLTTAMPTKIYDSGWFAVATGTTYTKTHSLGTTKVLINMMVGSASDGSGWVIQHQYYGVGGDGRQTGMVSLSTTQIGIRTGGNQIADFFDTSGTHQYPTSGYARIIMLALE